MDLAERDFGFGFHRVEDFNRDGDEGKAKVALPIAAGASGHCGYSILGRPQYVVHWLPLQREQWRNSKDFGAFRLNPGRARGRTNSKRQRG